MKKMKKNIMKTSKLKIAVVLGMLCCMAFGMTVMAAFDLYPPYTLSPNQTKTLAQFVPGVSTIYINTRPSAGGNVTISVGNASSTFPSSVSREDWKVPVSNPSATLTVKISATSRGASGTAHIWG